MLPLVALWSALLVLATAPVSSSPPALAGDAAADRDPHWRWTGSGACPHFCTCFKRHHLRRVECANRRLSGVDVGLPADTEVADLSHNLIATLEDGCFQELGLVQLRELWLQHNAIHTVGPWALTGLRRLRVLDLSYNHLQTLYANTFASSRGLNTLILAGNNLARLPADQPLPAAPRLQILDLSSCRIAHLGAVVLSEMPALASLNLSDNSLIQLQPQSLAAQQQLQILDLTRNPLACDFNTRQYVKQFEARNVSVRQSCPAKDDQSQIVSKSMARMLADIDVPGWEGEVQRGPPHVEGHEEGPVGARPAAAGPAGRTHEAMLDMAEDLSAFPPGDLVDLSLDDDDDDDDELEPEPTLSPAVPGDCKTFVFPERNTNNPSLVRPWFDPIPSFWASVAGCQVGLVLGLCLSSCLCRRSFWRALCLGCGRPPTAPAPLDDRAPLRDQGLDTSDFEWSRVRSTLGWSTRSHSRSRSGSLGSAPSTPCLWRDSFTSLERWQGVQRVQRPETPPPAYEDLDEGIAGRARFALRA